MEGDFEKRRESRLHSNLSVLVWGLDREGCAFAQIASASSISGHGALFSGIDQSVRCGDLVGVQYQSKRAKFRVIWTRRSESDGKVQLAVQRLAQDQCPWPEALPAVRNELATAKSAD